MSSPFSRPHFQCMVTGDSCVVTGTVVQWPTEDEDYEVGLCINRRDLGNGNKRLFFQHLRRLCRAQKMGEVGCLDFLKVWDNVVLSITRGTRVYVVAGEGGIWCEHVALK